MNRELRERLLLPFAVPIGSAAVILILVFGMSRVLLAAPKQVAVAVALMVAVNILAACALVAVRPRSLRVNSVLLLGVVLVPLALGLGAAANLRSEPAEAPAVPVQQVAVAAKDISFLNTSLRLAAGRESVLDFDNQDPVPHNVAIFSGADSTGKRVFTGSIFTGPATTKYKVGGLAAGSYFFHCDVHPSMTGTILAEEKTGS